MGERDGWLGLGVGRDRREARRINGNLQLPARWGMSRKSQRPGIVVNADDLS